VENKRFTLYIIGICVVLFVLQNIFPFVTDNFKLTSSLILQQPWTLITSMFLHGSLIHLLYNMLALAIFGLILENEIGSKKFLLVYLAAGIFAGLASIPFYNAVLGASGAIFGIIGTLTILKPKMQVFALGVPMPMFLAAIIWAALDLFGIFIPSDTANIAHLSGILVGIGIGFIIKQKQPKIRKRDSIYLNENDMQNWENRFMR